MYLVGIDLSKFKHDCFIATETGEVIKIKLLTFMKLNVAINFISYLLKTNNQIACYLIVVSFYIFRITISFMSSKETKMVLSSCFIAKFPSINL